jgi:hypothetical protein
MNGKHNINPSPHNILTSPVIKQGLHSFPHPNSNINQQFISPNINENTSFAFVNNVGLNNGSTLKNSKLLFQEDRKVTHSSHNHITFSTHTPGSHPILNGDNNIKSNPGIAYSQLNNGMPHMNNANNNSGINITSTPINSLLNISSPSKNMTNSSHPQYVNPMLTNSNIGMKFDPYPISDKIV